MHEVREAAQEAVDLEVELVVERDRARVEAGGRGDLGRGPVAGEGVVGRERLHHFIDLDDERGRRLTKVGVMNELPVERELLARATGRRTPGLAFDDPVVRVRGGVQERLDPAPERRLPEGVEVVEVLRYGRVGEQQLQVSDDEVLASQTPVELPAVRGSGALDVEEPLLQVAASLREGENGGSDRLSPVDEVETVLLV